MTILTMSNHASSPWGMTGVSGSSEMISGRITWSSGFGASVTRAGESRSVGGECVALLSEVGVEGDVGLFEDGGGEFEVVLSEIVGEVQFGSGA